MLEKEEKKIKVLRIINRFNLGGPTYNVTFLSAFLSDKFETKLIGGGHESYEEEALFIPEKYGVKIDIVNELQREIQISKDYRAYQKIREIIKEFKPDIVHTHASKSGAIGRLAASKENVPIIVHTFHGHVFHSYFGKIKSGFYKIIERYLAKKSTAIVAISKLQKKEIVETFKIAPENKVSIINLGFDLSKFNNQKTEKSLSFSNEYRIQENELCVGIIGRLTAIKNHDLFLKAMLLANEDLNRNIKVFVIGGGELDQQLKEKYNDLFKSQDNLDLIFTSWIKDVSIPLSRLDLVCLSSFNEGTPVSLIEAQAAGVPVISTNVGGVEDIMVHEGTGIIVRSFDELEYASALKRVLKDDNFREKLKMNGWLFVKEKFHYNTLCFNIEQLYLNLIKQEHERT